MHLLHVEARATALLGTLLLVLGASACGSNPVELPATPVLAPLAESFALDGPDVVDVDPSDFPVAPGSVEARWYQADGRYVVLLTGGFEDGPEGLCVNIWSGDTRFSAFFPTAAGACSGAPEREILPRNSAIRRCGPLLFFVTDIPADRERTLAANVVRFRGRVVIFVASIIHRSVAFPAEPAAELDLGARAYSVPAGTVSARPAVVEC
jgi:hypothetical protein